MTPWALAVAARLIDGQVSAVNRRGSDYRLAEYLAALDAAEPDPDRKSPKVISLSDPCSAWTAKANKRVQFGYRLNYLIDIDHAVIVGRPQWPL